MTAKHGNATISAGGRGLPAINQQTISSDSSLAASRPPARSELFGAGVAIALAAFYFVTSLYIAKHRLFWFDEILTVRIAGLPDLATIWDSLAHGADGTPPGYYLLARLSEKLLGSSEVAARLSSALAMTATLLITFDCARRLTDALHGLIALAMLSCSMLPYYGYEARSYAIYSMLAALSLWLWTRFPDRRRWPTVAFGGVLFVAITMHYYAVLLLVPYGLWELLRWRRGQRPSPKLIGGIVGVLLAAGVLASLMLSYSQQFVGAFSSTPWKPSLPTLRAVWGELLPDGLFLLALMMVWIVLARTIRRDDRDEESLPSATAAESVGWLFLSIPLAGFVVAEWVTHAFLPRYFIAMLPGVAVGLSCCLWRNFRQIRGVSLGIFLLFAMFGLVQQTSAARHPEQVGPYDQQGKIRHYLALESALHNEGKKYLVFSSSIMHLEFVQYAQAPNDSVLLLASDPSHRNMQNAMELNFARHYPLTTWEIYEVEQHAAQVALIEPREDFLQELKRDGYKPVVRFPGPLEIVYLQ